MARNGSGTYTVPNTFVAGTAITASDHNENWTDIAAEITNSIAADGQTPFTGALKLEVGSAASPGVTFSSDTDTGIYRKAANELGFSTGGTAAAYFDSAQKFWALGAVDVAGAFSVTGAATFASTLGVTGAFTGTSATLTGLLTLSTTAHMLVPVGTTAERSGVVAGSFRYNSTTGLPEFADGTSFASLSAAQPVAAGFKNLTVTNNAATPNTQIDIDADAITVETSTGRVYRLTSVNLTINCGTTGANALDAGAIGNSTWYYAYVIYNPATDTTAGLASTSATSPTLPSGYTAVARVGALPTNGSAQFYRVLQKGRRAQYVVGSGTTTTALRQIAGGAAGNVTTPTWSAHSISTFVPSTASAISVVLTGGAGESIAAPNNSYGGRTGYTSGNMPPLSAGAIVAQSGTFLLESTNFYFAANDGDGRLLCFGWEDNI